MALKNLCDAGIVDPYPPLCDSKGCYVAQVGARRAAAPHQSGGWGVHTERGLCCERQRAPVVAAPGDPWKRMVLSRTCWRGCVRGHLSPSVPA